VRLRRRAPALPLRDRHVVLTGATRGIGRGLADELAARGARLTVVARDSDVLTKTAAELGAAAVPADLADPAQLATVVPSAERANGPVDVVINNAGLQAATALADVDPGRLRDVVITNVLAPLELCRQALVTMLPRGSGALVNVSSLAGEFALRNIIPYCSSKAALTTATLALRRELTGTGVRAQLAMLGYVATDMMNESQADPISGAQATRLGRLPALSVDSVARDIADGIERGRPLMVLPPLAAPVHHFRQIPTRLVDTLMVGIPRSHPHNRPKEP
jgi:short-subunit dehydrogenase